MKIEQALKDLYEQTGFDLDTGKGSVYVYIGPYLVSLPNIKTRKKFIKYHDLHHLINQYDSSKLGEGEVSAWELGSGSFSHPILLLMNLIAISTALFINPKRLLLAFMKGCKSKNFYSKNLRQKIESGELYCVEQLKQECINCYELKNYYLNMILFIALCISSIFVLSLLLIPAYIYKNSWGVFFNNHLVKVLK